MPEQPPACKGSLYRGRIVNLEGAPCFASSAFVPHESIEGGELCVGNGAMKVATKLCLLNTEPEDTSRVAYDNPGGDGIFGLRLSPDQQKACFSVGLSCSKLVMCTLTKEGPWKQDWEQSKPGLVLEIDFSDDSSLVVCSCLSTDTVDVHSVENQGKLLRTLKFKTPSEATPLITPYFRLRMSKSVLAISGCPGTTDESVIGIWSLGPDRLPMTAEEMAGEKQGVRAPASLPAVCPPLARRLCLPPVPAACACRLSPPLAHCPPRSRHCAAGRALL